MKYDIKKLGPIFAANVKRICKERNIKIGVLEEKINISRGYISRMATGEKNLSINIMFKASNVLDVTIDELCSELSNQTMFISIFGISPEEITYDFWSEPYQL